MRVWVFINPVCAWGEWQFDLYKNSEVGVGNIYYQQINTMQWFI